MSQTHPCELSIADLVHRHQMDSHRCSAAAVSVRLPAAGLWIIDDHEMCVSSPGVDDRCPAAWKASVGVEALMDQFPGLPYSQHIPYPYFQEKQCTVACRDQGLLEQFAVCVRSRCLAGCTITHSRENHKQHMNKRCRKYRGRGSGKSVKGASSWA